MKIMSLALLLITFVCLYGVLAKAQSSKRIQFARGKTSTVIKEATGSNGVVSVIKGESGQKLILNLTPTSKIGIKVATDGANGEVVLLRDEKGGGTY